MHAPHKYFLLSSVPFFTITLNLYNFVLITHPMQNPNLLPRRGFEIGDVGF